MSSPIGLFATILAKVFAFVFRASKDVSQDASSQLVLAFNAVRKLGVKRIREFIVALPIFIEFVRQLLIHRDQLSARKQLYIIGAAAALSTLGLVVLISVITSLPVQILLLITQPLIGIPLLVSGGVVISAIIIVLLWLIIYVLNLMLSDDPIYQRIRDSYVPKHTQEILDQVQKEIEQSGADVGKLKDLVGAQLEVRGSHSDPKTLAVKLHKLEGRLQNKKFARMAGISDQPVVGIKDGDA